MSEELRISDRALLSLIQSRRTTNRDEPYEQQITCNRVGGWTIPFSHCRLCNDKCQRFKDRSAYIEKYNKNKR